MDMYDEVSCPPLKSCSKSNGTQVADTRVPFDISMDANVTLGRIFQ